MRRTPPFRSIIRPRSDKALVCATVLLCFFDMLGCKKKEKSESSSEDPAAVPVSGAQPETASGAAGASSSYVPVQPSVVGPISIDSETVSAGVSIGIGDAIPFQLTSVGMTVNTEDGSGNFTFNLQCSTNVSSDHACLGFAQADFTADLGLDTFLDDTASGDLTLEECVLLATGPLAAGPTATFAQADANADLPAGGAVFQRIGPAPACIAINASLIFAVAHPDSSSCKWWRIKVDCS